MKIITLTSEKHGNHEVMVDDSDYEFLAKFKWHLSIAKSGGKYATAWDYRCNPRKRVLMHRIILGLSNPKEFVDHKDRNGLNNQRDNLRVANYSQNSQNKSVCGRNLSGFKGVVLNRENKYKKYTAVIIANGKRIFGGGFKTPEEAARRWNELARIHHGEFAYQNPV